MELKLFRNKTIRELKKQFSKNFSFLKLEFFFIKYRKEEGSAMQQKIADHTCLSDLSFVHREGLFSFTKSTTVNEFEQRMQKEFGLPVQVFRKAGDVWIETIQTDHLDLAKQNSMAESSGKVLPFNINSLFL